MKHLLLFLLGLSLAGTVSAQTPQDLALPNAKIVDDRSWSIAPAGDQPASSQSPLAETIRLSYFDPNGTVIPWQAAWQPNDNEPNFLVLGYGQRFTLPAASGFLDSIRVVIQQVVEDVAGGGINFFITPAELVPSPKGGPDQYLPVITQAGIIASASVPASSFQGSTNVTLSLRTDHIAVPKEFFVFITPSIVNSTYSARFVIPGEVKQGVPTTTQNSRSVLLYRVAQEPLLEVMDNFFQVSGQNVAVNFGMEAFVDVEGASVAAPQASSASMFPNPVAINGMLNIEHAEQINSVSIVNMLGNEMQSWTGKSTSAKLSTSELAPGVYHVIVNTESGVTTEKLIVN